jgi:hypothetical protein
MRTAISSFPRAVLVTPVIGLVFLPRGSVLTVTILQLLPLPLFKAARPERLPAKVRSGPGVPLSTSTYCSAASCMLHHLSGWLPCTGSHMRFGDLVIYSSRGLGDSHILSPSCPPRGSPRSRPVCREFSSGHCQLQVLAGIIVDVVYKVVQLG